MPNYVSIDHSASFQGQAPWVQATPLEDWHLPALTKQTATVILVHGFANSGAAWQPIAHYLQESLPYAKFILPNAPIIPVNVPGGKLEALPAWFNFGGAVPDWDAPSAIADTAGWDKTYNFIEGIVEEEAKIVGAGRVFLGGFSQGTFVTTVLALRNKNVGGVIGLAARIPFREDLATSLSANSVLEKSFFWGHGEADILAPVDYGLKSVQWLSSTFGVKYISEDATPEKGTVKYITYPGLAHFTSEKEVDDIRDWLKVVLPA